MTTATLREYHALVERCARLNRDGITGMLGFGFSVGKLTHFIRETRRTEWLAPYSPPAAAAVGS